MEVAMAIIGRKEERRQLDDYYYSGRLELIIVYGRRRVGKTFLLNLATTEVAEM